MKVGMKIRAIAVLVAVALAGTLTVGSVALASSKTSKTSAPQSTFTGIPVTGACSNNGTAGTFTGTLDVTRFVFSNGHLWAIGSLTGTCSAGGALTDQKVRLPVRTPAAAAQQGGNQLVHTCRILDLILGPLHLDLLGLVIDLNRVHLRITAEEGPGNLLGNLLCAIAGLLDHNRLDVVAPILNAIKQLLG